MFKLERVNCISNKILYFRRIPLLPTTFYISYAYWYFYHIYISETYRYFLTHLIFHTHTDTSYHIYISNAHRYFLPHFTFLKHTDTSNRHFMLPTHTGTCYQILYFLLIPILPTIFYISNDYWKFLSHFIFPTHTDTSYNILYLSRIPILPTTSIYPTYTVTSYNIVYFRGIPILAIKFYISDAYRFFLRHFIS